MVVQVLVVVFLVVVLSHIRKKKLNARKGNLRGTWGGLPIDQSWDVGNSRPQDGLAKIVANLQQRPSYYERDSRRGQE